MSKKYTLQDFQQCVQQTFLLAGGQETAKVELVLESVIPYQAEGQEKPDSNAFSLLFKGAADFFLPQGLYAMENQHLGLVEIFITPLGRLADNNFQYEAVFN
jgi:hypothetical protein